MDIDERQDVQKRTFTKWINARLIKTNCGIVSDLFVDLRDGHKLLSLLEVLTQQKYIREKGNLRVHWILNVNKVLQILQDHRVTLLNISSEDIVSGNPKLTLSLIWLIALNFDGRQLHVVPTENTLESSLLKWVQSLTKPFGVQVKDFSSSWSDGRAFLYLMLDSVADFNLDDVLKRHPTERLRVAFELAKTQLNIEPLLDPNDVAKRPDKKSIVLYVMCMYHVIKEQNRTRTVTKPAYKPAAFRTEAHTNTSVIVTEMNTYQTSVENVLALLLEAENLLSGEVSTQTDLATAKAQFERHEKFMIRMSTYQQYVGCALEDGARLLTDTQLSMELSAVDLGEIKQQMSLLNERWETLRMRALTMQSCVHETLATIQMGKVDDLRAILTDIENRVANMGEISSNPSVLQLQYDQQAALETHLAEQKAFVDSLSNLVVIVNDELFNDFEDKLNALGERWHHLIKWTETRKVRLDAIRGRYRSLNERATVAAEWVNTRETDLKSMERDEVTEIGNIMQRINDVRYCDHDLHVLADVLADLEQEAIGLESTNLLETIEGLNDRCDALKEILRAQQMRIRDMGFKLSTEQSRYLVAKPERWSDFQRMMSAPPVTMDTAKVEVKSAAQQKFDGECEMALDYLRSVDDIVDRLQTQDGNALQSDTLDRISTELNARLQSLDKLGVLLEDCKLNNTNAAVHKKRIEEIRLKYKRATATVQELEQISRNSASPLTALKLMLADCRDWFKSNAHQASYEELTMRLNQMQSLQVERDSSDSSDLLDWEQFVDSWQDLKDNIECLLKNNQQAQANSLKQKCATLLSEISDTKVLKSNMHNMHVHLKVFEQFNKAYTDLMHEIETSTDTADLRKIQEQCAAIKTLLNDKIIKQTAIVESLNHFNTEIEAAQRSLKHLEQELSADTFLPGDLPELYATFAEYEAYEQQLKKIEIDQISVRNFGDILRQDSAVELSTEISAQIERLNSAYTAGIDRFRNNSKRLHHVIQRAEQMLLRIEQTELWLTDLEMSTPRLGNAQISSLNELFQLKTRFQALKETCEQRTDAFRELNEEGSDMLVQIDEYGTRSRDRAQSETSQWAKQFTKLNARWTDVTSHVYARTALLEHVYGQLGEFKKLVVSETGYLDRLEKCLRKSPEAAADAEEIYEELDNLENTIRSHSDDRMMKICDVVEEMVEHDILSKSITDEVQALKTRWVHLKNEAMQREQQLEIAMSEAQYSEKRISNMQTWINRMEVIFNIKPGDDFTGDGMAYDVEVFSTEFNNNEHLLEVFEQEVATHRAKGRIEAADRLNEQLEMLKIRFMECRAKFHSFIYSNSFFESRLNRALIDLRTIEKSAYVLENTASSVVELHEQYQRCVKLYRSLSEVKSEIENVIKTGRKICEINVTKNKKTMSNSIDVLKHLFNSLGEHVTKSKKGLEENLTQLKVLQENLRQLEHLKMPTSADSNSEFKRISEFVTVLQQTQKIFDQHRALREIRFPENLREKLDGLSGEFCHNASADQLQQLLDIVRTLEMGSMSADECSNILKNEVFSKSANANVVMLQNHIYSLKPVSVILENLGNMNNDTQALQNIKETAQNSSAPDPETTVGEVSNIPDHGLNNSIQHMQHAEAIHEDSQRYEAKRLEIETWLNCMENRAKRMGSVATTVDVLEAQQKEQKTFHAELHQYRQQIDLLGQLTQMLIKVYPTDDSSKIKRLTETVNQRYTNLIGVVINRGKLLHTAVHNLQSFDRSMDQFLAWLSEEESLCENAEQESDRNPLILKN